MTKNSSDGDFDIVFKHFVSPQLSRGKILTDSFLLLWEKTSPTEKNVQYPIAGHPRGAVFRAYGGWQKGSGLNQRGRFIINPDGIIMGVAVLTGPVGRNVEELIRQIKAMQAVAENPARQSQRDGNQEKSLSGSLSESIKNGYVSPGIFTRAHL